MALHKNYLNFVQTLLLAEKCRIPKTKNVAILPNFAHFSIKLDFFPLLTRLFSPVLKIFHKRHTACF